MYQAEETTSHTFDYSLEDYLGNTDWRNWDNRFSQYDIDNSRRCRGNGFVDLNASALMSDKYCLTQDYEIIKMKKPGIFGATTYFARIPNSAKYVCLDDVTAYHSYGMVIGFWRDPASGGAIPFDFEEFDKTKCPIQAFIVVPPR